MDNLVERIAAARDLAAEREGDIRIKEFLRAMNICPTATGADPSAISITAHWRYWHRFFFPTELEKLRTCSVEELADMLPKWLQGAFDNDMLSLSEPPGWHRTQDQGPRT